MLGVYDYTVILTYLSTVSAGLGTLAALSGEGHPYFGAFCLLFCGLCDGFDGKVARTKKDRTEYEKKFGIQIDSLSDLISFGVLPGIFVYCVTDKKLAAAVVSAVFMTVSGGMAMDAAMLVSYPLIFIPAMIYSSFKSGRILSLPE